MSNNGSERKLREFKERPLRPGAPGAERPKGRLLIIGGKEDKEDQKVILRELARLVGSGKLVVATVASGSPDESMERYESVLRSLGVRHLYHLKIEERADAETVKALNILEGATAVYFTGGDQLKITSQIGDTPVYSRIYEIFLQGGTIAGTSAGAAVMSETMIVGGGQNGSHRIGENLRLAPGLGFAKDMVIDQHFAERGRMSRLLGVVAQNPRIIGIGIDENTAIEVRAHRGFRVIGEGGVYVIDGRDVMYSNVAEEEQSRTLSVFGVQLHLLSQGDTFDLVTREPTAHPAEEVDEELLGKEEREPAGEAADA
ncbi:MAG TPA: cyanophycinase [Gemmatimonadaceae bacterium]|nr:cyanophycinase [Gemmatimonadaceae bacterium]